MVLSGVTQAGTDAEHVWCCPVLHKRTLIWNMHSSVRHYTIKVRDKVGPPPNNRGNIISDGFQMAAVLNEYFSSVFTTVYWISAQFQFHLLNLRAINQNI